jgi:hypothetical protein
MNKWTPLLTLEVLASEFCSTPIRQEVVKGTWFPLYIIRLHIMNYVIEGEQYDE